MRIKNKTTGEIGRSNSFVKNNKNIVLVIFGRIVREVNVQDYDAEIKGIGFVDMEAAFEKRLVIPDQFMNYFREPRNEMERARGYFE